MPKISGLPTATNVNPTDFVVVVDNSAVPETKKAQASLLSELAPVQTVAGKDGTVTLDTADIDGLAALLAKTVYSDSSGISGASQILNVVALTQSAYDAIATPQATTLYVIRDA
jgi:hypothetical protein